MIEILGVFIPKVMRTNSFIYEVDVYVDKKMFNEARACLEQALCGDPENPTFRVLLGKVQSAMIGQRDLFNKGAAGLPSPAPRT